MRSAIIGFLATAISGAAAPQPADLAAAFGSRAAVEQASLSPDGKRVAMIMAGPGRTSALYAIDTAGGADPKRILVASGKPEELSSCGWVANDRLACTITGLTEYEGTLARFSSVVAVDAAGGNLKVLSERRGQDALYVDLRGGSVIDLLPEENGTVLMTRSYVPEQRTGTHVGKLAEGLGVDRIDSRSGRTERVEVARNDAVEYITDGRGRVRILGLRVADSTGYDKGAVRYLYRPKDSSGWQPLSIHDYVKGTGFNPYAVDPDKDLAYGFEEVDGRQVLTTLSLDAAKRREVVYARPDVDIDGLIRIGRKARVVGASYATEKRETIYFDPQVKAQAAALAKALGGGRRVEVVDASLDEARLLIWAGSDTDPGQYYLYDKAAKTLEPLIPERPQLAAMTLAPVKPIRYPAADGTMIPGYLTVAPGKEAKALPAIVLPHGGPSARDEWGFDWLAQYLAIMEFTNPHGRGRTADIGVSRHVRLVRPAVPR